MLWVPSLMPDSPTVLIIDDDEPFRSALHGVFERSNFRVFDTGSGKRGIELAVANRPDAIVCDYQMEELNGLEVLRQVRTTLAISGIPAVLISGASPSEIVPYLDSLGSTEFLAKPFVFSDLVNIIRSRVTSAASTLPEPAVRFDLFCDDLARYLVQRFPAISWRIQAVGGPEKGRIGIFASIVTSGEFQRATLTTCIEADAFKGLDRSTGEYKRDVWAAWAESAVGELRRG